MLTSFLWKDEPAFLTRWKYGPGEAPEDHHPAGWPKMEVHRYGKLFERGTGNPYWSVAVHSTRRARNGWTYNVAELKARPVWIAYFHHAATGQRVQHAMSENALALAQAFGLYRVAG
jgi:hypothetical protein